MRQRGPTEQQQAKQPSPAAAAAARASASKRPSTRRSRTRGFWIATGCFLSCLVVYICFSSGNGGSLTASASTRSRSTKSGLRVAERDVVALRLATQQVVAATTLPNFEELSRTAAPIGAAYLSLLEEVAAAEELEDGGHALRQLDVSQHYLTSVGTALRAAADVAYTKLQRMLLQLPNAELALAPTSLVRTMYGWMLCDLFLYGAVLPEYYLLQDDTASHAAVLLRAVNLLSWTHLVHTVPSAQPDNEIVVGAETMYDLFNWSGGGNTACRKGPAGAVSKAWLRFCESSFVSAAAAARRAAATWEELIVLFPEYAPLRLHYAVSFAFLAPSSVDAPGALSEHAMKVLRVIRNDREKLGVRYKHADVVHAPLLVLLEAYLTPVDLWTANQETELVQALTDLEGCAHVRASLLSASKWHGGVLAREYRMPLLNAEELRSLLSKARVHLGADHAALSSFTECM